MTLLREIQQSAVGEDTSVTVLLRQCLVLSSRLQHGPLREWAERELEGYPSDVDLPPYRPKVRTQVIGDFSGFGGSYLRNQALAEGGIPDELGELREGLFTVEVRQGVAELERLVSSGEPTLYIQWPMDLVARVQDRFMQGMNLMGARQVIPVTVFASALSGIRDRVVQFALDIEAENPDAGEADPGERPVPESRVTQIFNHAVFGDHAAVAAAGRDVQQTTVEWTVIDGTLQEFGIAEGDRTALAEVIEAEGMPVDGKPGPQTRRWLDRLEQGAIQVGTGASVQTAVAVIGRLLGVY